MDRTLAAAVLLASLACATAMPPPAPLGVAPSAAASPAASAAKATFAPPALPASLAPPAGSAPLWMAAARGVQIYLCKPAADDATKLAWAFKAPEAQLFDGSGAPSGKHYAGPTWEALDGSKVVGEVREKFAVADSIPLLLLKAKSTEGGGLLSKAGYIQRADTKGGGAPNSPCTAGQESRIDYTATYYFYSAPQPP